MSDIIASTEALAAACARFARHEFVTVDTEFMRETTYWPKLCIIQIASEEEAVIVDAEAPGLDLAPFFQLMADETVLKVFHAARQDIEIVWHLGGILPHPIFDSQVAAMVCGFGDSISYDQLVGRITGHSIDKTSRFTDWSHRPLTQHQIDYALADVTHLRDVYKALRDQLERQSRSDWVSEEMKVLTSVDTYQVDPEQVWKRLKLRIKKPLQLAVLQELAAWREREAQARDVPRGRVIKDDAIYEIAEQHPATAEALGRLRSIPKGFERSRVGEEILAIVQRASSLPKDKLPKVPKTRPASEGNGAAVDLLKVLLKMTSEEHGVAAKVIATVDELEAIANDDKADVAPLAGWRRELFGENALKLKRGELAMRLDGRRVVLVGEPTSEA
ncbi:ribonuclease D [Kaistia algarum]|uniref:ribonuclease D n=1 Tax=Kaistia algarum TaxID=2083279 RepID=UPI000CE7F908|nr:ribonuclease D [Kaistia algarum]MCX5511902.1 ribonuclease D [Kaistia algarum]PPE80037.1 ribonuclease D [Kaistia algarum]